MSPSNHHSSNQSSNRSSHPSQLKPVQIMDGPNTRDFTSGYWVRKNVYVEGLFNYRDNMQYRFKENFLKQPKQLAKLLFAVGVIVPAFAVLTGTRVSGFNAYYAEIHRRSPPGSDLQKYQTPLSGNQRDRLAIELYESSQMEAIAKAVEKAKQKA